MKEVVEQAVAVAAAEGLVLHFDQSCVICGNSTPGRLIGTVQDHEYPETTQLEFPVVECPECKTLYLYPRPDESELDRIYPSNYYAHSMASSGSNGERKLTVVEQLLEQRAASAMKQRLNAISLSHRPNQPLRVLDIGCGTGRHLDLLRHVHPDIETHGIDISAPAVQIAMNHGHRAYHGRFEDIDLPEGYFDFILSLHVIEHVARPDRFLERCSKLLQPQGKILIETPNTNCWEYRTFKKRHWGGYHSPRHWYLFQLRSLEILAKRLHLNVIGYGQYTNAFFLAWTLHSICCSLLGRTVADVLFPPVKIYFGGPYCLLLLGSLSVFAGVMKALTGSASSMWIGFEKDFTTDVPDR